MVKDITVVENDLGNYEISSSLTSGQFKRIAGWMTIVNEQCSEDKKLGYSFIRSYLDDNVDEDNLPYIGMMDDISKSLVATIERISSEGNLLVADLYNIKLFVTILSGIKKSSYHCTKEILEIVSQRQFGVITAIADSELSEILNFSEVSIERLNRNFSEFDMIDSLFDYEDEDRDEADA